MDTFITRKDSVVLKGIAVLMMMMMHIFKTPWMDNPNLILDIKLFGDNLSYVITDCIHYSTPIFAFLTGYAIKNGFSSSGKTKRIARLYLSFWVVCIFVNLPMYYINSKFCGDEEVLSVAFAVKNALALSSQISIFCWYVSFFLLAVITGDYLYRLFQKVRNCYMRIGFVVVLFIFCRGGVIALGKTGVLDSTIISLLQHYNTTMPSWIIGMIVAEEGIYNKWNLFLSRKKDKLPLYLSYLFLTFITIFNYLVRFRLHIQSDMIHFYVVFEMFALTIVAKNICHTKTLETLGKYSLYMWLIHAVFILRIMQPITYFTRIPIIVFMFVLVVTFIIAKVVSRIDFCLRKMLKL